jgi:DNA topoisomerase-1
MGEGRHVAGKDTSRRLVIVESPAKARTIAGYLGDGYDVEASVGHIRDLPNPSELPADMKKGPYGRFAVDVDNGFDPYYVVDPDKRKKVADLRRLLKDADELFLATDEDREGEAIAWHLREVLKPTVPVRRMVFHEITPEAIRAAVNTTRDIDMPMVDAQETRRILDRLYGYEVSPVLWRKVRQGLSAGRVQSVATRLVVERERERMAFRAASYWDVVADVSPQGDPGSSFAARLVGVDGHRVATGRDFADTGELRTSDVVHLDQELAQAIAGGIQAAPVAVRSVQERPYTRRPAAPFTTSTLQQEASRKLRFSSKHAMSVAQRLYENGYITYMRTDSTTLSEAALSAARSQARELYGEDYVPQAPRRYERKVKNAQEAHEAIRPAGDRFRTPAQVAGELRGEEFALYELIWKRTVASQMADASGSTATVRLAATLDDGRDVELSASGTVITFRGFLAAYEEGRDEDRAAADEAREEDRRLPQLAAGDPVDTLSVAADGHETSPPPRFTEATLVKALEERGIGRPSTYAATIGTIVDRGYVRRRGSALVPTWLAFAVTRLLERHFPRLVDYDFTAGMEEDLDRIAGGEEQRVEWLRKFYFGDGSVTGVTNGATGPSGDAEGLRALVEDLGDIDARDISTVPLGEDLVLRVGRYGPYVESTVTPEGEEPRRATVPDDIAPDELTPAKARELLAASADDGRVLGTDPVTGHEIIARAGRYGPYVTEVLPDPAEPAPAETAAPDGAPADAAPKAKKKKAAKKAAAAKPRTGSLFAGMSLDTVTLEDALRLLSLPRVVGADPESGEEITAQNGRYGPYLKKGTDSRSLEREEQLFTVTLEEALALYAQPKLRGRQAAAPLAELGPDPVSTKPIVVKDGRFGPYVTDGETNATLRKDDDPATMTLERAIELLADKRARGPAPKRRTTKKAAAKKAPAKRTAKKAAAKR